MQSVIQRVPPGLLSLLDLKTMGQNPSVLSDTVQPTLDLAQLYVSNLSEYSTDNTANITSPGGWVITTLRPNPGEFFIVDLLSMRSVAVLGAGTTYRLRLSMFNVQSNESFFVGPSASATTGEQLAGYSDKPFILTAGFGIAIWCEGGVFGVPAGFRVTSRFIRLRV